MKELNQKTAFTISSFSTQANKLRREFDERFDNPHHVHSGRFVWDYWHTPGQYTQLRTPAPSLFSPQAYKKFHEELLRFGREQLGCYQVTLPWLSCYVSGCKQNIHADIPHGPWAFVFSLTNWSNRKFSGGETFILKPSTLDYWSSFQKLNGVEKNDLITEISPVFNQLTVFDPRLPHGVNEVRGADSVTDGRLVIHGWFTEPEPYVTGALSRPAATKALNEILDRLFQDNHLFANIHGTLSYQLKVSKSGAVTHLRRVTSTLRSSPDSKNITLKVLNKIETEIKKQKFSSARGPSQITLPLLFRF